MNRQRWYVYAFNGDRLFAAYATHMNEPHLSCLKMNGWKVFKRRSRPAWKALYLRRAPRTRELDMVVREIQSLEPA